MKRLATYLVMTVLGLITTIGQAQITVTGHVFAEVVESVSVSSQSQSNINIQRNNTEEINIGQIDLRNSSSSSFSLLLGKLNITYKSQELGLNESSSFETHSIQGNVNGDQFIDIQCQPDKKLDHLKNLHYNGDINIVLAYN